MRSWKAILVVSVVALCVVAASVYHGVLIYKSPHCWGFLAGACGLVATVIAVRAPSPV